MFPGLPYYIEVKSNNKKTLMTLIKDLNLTIDPRKHIDMGADTMYFDLYNIKKNHNKTELETIENLKELISEYNLTEHVKIHLNIANRKQMANIYRKSDVFISTSNYETFGVALAESISCGCFGISLMNGGSLEIINDGVNGFLLSEIEILNLEQVIKKIDFSQLTKYL